MPAKAILSFLFCKKTYILQSESGKYKTKLSDPISKGCYNFDCGWGSVGCLPVDGFPLMPGNHAWVY